MAELEQTLGHRVTLDSLCEHTLQEKKSGNGRKAVQWWREKELEKLADYCKRDVYLTACLFRFGVAYRHLDYWNYSTSAEAQVHVPDWGKCALKWGFSQDDLWTGLTQLKILTP